MTIESEYQDIAGMRVAVYFNVHRKQFSVKAMEGLNTGKVICHCDTLALRNAEFRVSQPGRARVLREGVKNVHAFIIGILAYPVTITQGHAVTYNPRHNESFIWRKSGQPIHSAKFVQFSNENQPMVTATQ